MALGRFPFTLLSFWPREGSQALDRRLLYRLRSSGCFSAISHCFYYEMRQRYGLIRQAYFNGICAQNTDPVSDHARKDGGESRAFKKTSSLL